MPPEKLPGELGGGGGGGGGGGAARAAAAPPPPRHKQPVRPGRVRLDLVSSDAPILMGRRFDGAGSIALSSPFVGDHSSFCRPLTPLNTYDSLTTPVSKSYPQSHLAAVSGLISRHLGQCT